MKDESIFLPIEQYLLEEGKKPRRHDAFYPSDASCVVDGKVVGKCLRAQYYQWMGLPQEPMNYRGWVTTRLGSAYEYQFLYAYQKQGLLKARNVPAHAVVMGLNVRGRLDGLTYGGEGIEVKTGYGAKFCYTVAVNPKLDHLCQIMLYMGILGIDTFLLPYGSRDDGGKRVGWRLRKKDIEGYGILLIKILARWKTLQRYVIEKKEPPRDFNLHLDWNCKYCSFWRRCWPQEEIDKFFQAKVKKGKK